MSGEYERFLAHVREHGQFKGDRTGTGTFSVFGHQMRFDLQEGFPLVTTKKIYIRGVVGELIWMLKGDTNIKWLNDHDIHIWDEWALTQTDIDEDPTAGIDHDPEVGDLGRVYGAQWRRWMGKPMMSANGYTATHEYVDQIKNVIAQIKANPDSRRHIVTAWNPAEVEDQALPPCHMMFQFYVLNGKLSCQLYQRSADIFLGVPFNIASYALLTHMVAQQCGLQVGEFIWTGGDCHIYSNHLEQVDEQLTRSIMAYPKLELLPRPSIDAYEIDDVIISDYSPHPAIKAPVAV